MLIAIKQVINELERGTDLFAENQIQPPPKYLRLPVNEPKPQGKPRKKPYIKNKVEQNGFVNDNISIIRTEVLHDRLA